MPDSVAEPQTLMMDGIPLPVVRPASLDELQQAVRAARAAGEAVYPVGGGTLLGFGLPPRKPGRAVDLRGLAQVVDYPARDMTITVQAGITVAALQEVLAAENQRLPVDVPRAAAATLGGSLAANASGPRRFGFGTLRDYVIGISVVNDEGHAVKAGGRVVKNVAGYDLCKLYIGSLGTLGVIAQVTLKVVPRPEEQAVVLLRADAGRVGELLDRLHGSATRPAIVEALNAEAVRLLGGAGIDVGPHGWLVTVGFEGNPEAVRWQVQRLVREIHTEFPLEARVGAAAEPLLQALVEFPAAAAGELTFHANMLPSAVADFCAAAAASGRVALQAHAGSGIVTGHLRETARDEAARLLEEWRGRLAGAGAGLVVRRCPVEWKEPNLVWGRPPAAAAVMRAVKARLDPKNLFNPGRFLAGI